MFKNSITVVHSLKNRDDIHIARKLWHFIGVMVIAIFHSQLQRMDALIMITFFTLLFVFLDMARLLFPKLNVFFINVFHPFMREHERDGLAGTTHLFIGTAVIIIFFPPEIAFLSLLFLAIADPIASYVGVLYGTDKIWGNKSLQGSMAAFISCTATSAVYFYLQNVMSQRLLIVSLIAGLIGAASELITIGKLDDNLTFPILSSCFLWGLYFIFGGF